MYSSMNYVNFPQPYLSLKSIMRPANKASLADSLWLKEIQSAPKPPKSVQHVLDGGSLLHKIPLSKGAVWDEILQMYTD